MMNLSFCRRLCMFSAKEGIVNPINEYIIVIHSSKGSQMLAKRKEDSAELIFLGFVFW